MPEHEDMPEHEPGSCWQDIFPDPVPENITLATGYFLCTMYGNLFRKKLGPKKFIRDKFGYNPP